MNKIDEIFGTEIGALIKKVVRMLLLVIFMAAMWLAMLLPSVISKWAQPSENEKYTKQLKELPEDTQELVAEIIEVNSHTQQIIRKLENEANETEKK